VYLLAVCLAAVLPLHGQAPRPNGSNSSNVAPGQTARQAAPVIERIEFEGNRRIRGETLLGRMFTRAGDPYSAEGLERDFQALWNTQYFDDIRLEVQDSPDRPNAKIVIFHVDERPVIRRIEYHGLKSVSESDILDQYKDRKVNLSVEGSFDPTKIEKAVVVIRDLESEHGHQFATVKTTYQRIPATQAVKLIFTVDEGPKVKVGLITFQGNTVFSNR
jgi:outer membrane protein insertion porin family